MKRKGKSVLPSPFCLCEGKVRSWFKRCHGTSQCCPMDEQFGRCYSDKEPWDE